LTVVVRIIPAGIVPATVAVCDAGNGPAAVHVSLPVTDDATVNGVAGSIGEIVTTLPALEACTRLPTGSDVVGSTCVAPLIAAARLAARAAVVLSVAATVYETDTVLADDRNVKFMTTVSDAWSVPPTVNVVDAGTGGPAVYVPALAGLSEQAKVKGAPALAATTVTTGEALDAAARLFSGKPENGSGTVAPLIKAAMFAATEVGVSLAATTYGTATPSMLVVRVSPALTVPPIVAVWESGDEPAAV
jgi:hypothetical protein